MYYRGWQPFYVCVLLTVQLLSPIAFSANSNNVKNSTPFKLQHLHYMALTDCRAWLSLFTKQTKITTRCREHDLQALQCCMLRTAAERIMISLRRISVGIVQTQSVQQTKITDYFIIEIQKKIVVPI